ncbi:MAG: NAD(P)H-quinone oxidoreductase [Proteobacteria bacterium]|nr:NAD(P)H-quinone oxidoreductase [Pseudomonadota bacterium]
MKAIQIDGQKLNWSDAEAPKPGPCEVAIRVRATAINRADLAQRAGVYPPPPGASEILGLECAGEIQQLGEGVTDWKIGDAVCALLSGGGYAETVVCPAGHLLPKPKNLSFEQAAALPEVFATAWLNIFQEAALQPNESVLLHAGASGVGTAAIQLCRHFGNPCFVTASGRQKIDYCIELGADGGFDRSSDLNSDLSSDINQGSFAEAVKAWRKDSSNKGVDVILDPVGGSYLSDNMSCLAVNGRLVLIGLMGGANADISLGLLMVKRFKLIGSTLRSRTDGQKTQLIQSLREQVWPLFDSGQLTPIIHTTMPITEAEQGFALVESNKTIGKVVLTIP